MKRLHVVVLHQAVAADSLPDELDVLDEVSAVGSALKTLGHKVTVLPMSAALDETRRALDRARPDCVFNLVESLLNCGALASTATALLDALGIPYTGSNTAAMALTTNKLLTKHALRRSGILTPPWLCAREQYGFRPGTYIVKPISEDASIGLDEDSLLHLQTLSEGRRELEKRSQRMGRPLFAERFIEGREFNISLLGTSKTPRVLPIAEIEFRGFKERNKATLVGYRAKWDTESFEYQNTTRSFTVTRADRALHRSLTELARTAWTVVGCSGYARVDLRVDLRGRPHVLELNTNPCIAPDAGFAVAANRGGFEFPRLVAELLRIATDGP